MLFKIVFLCSLFLNCAVFASDPLMDNIDNKHNSDSDSDNGFEKVTTSSDDNSPKDSPHSPQKTLNQNPVDPKATLVDMPQTPVVVATVTSQTPNVVYTQQPFVQQQQQPQVVYVQSPAPMTHVQQQPQVVYVQQPTPVMQAVPLATNPAELEKQEAPKLAQAAAPAKWSMGKCILAGVGVAIAARFVWSWLTYEDEENKKSV